LHVNRVPVGGKIFPETCRAQMLRAGAHAHIALAGIVRDKKKPCFHFSKKLPQSVALLTAMVNAGKLKTRTSLR